MDLNTYVYSIKFFVLRNDGVVFDGFANESEAKDCCARMNRESYGSGYNFSVYYVSSANDDDKELERIRESFFYQLQAREAEEWER